MVVALLSLFLLLSINSSVVGGGDIVVSTIIFFLFCNENCSLLIFVLSLSNFFSMLIKYLRTMVLIDIVIVTLNLLLLML